MLTGRRLLWLVASMALAIALLVLLFDRAGLDLAGLARLLSSVSPQSAGEILILLGVNNALSAEKWRLIALRLQAGDGAGMPRRHYFAFTSIGVALGQVVPAQLSLVLSRSLGAHLYGGRALQRGGAATLFDYFFDLLIAALLGLVSLLVLTSGGGAANWIGGALLIGGAVLLLYGAAVRGLAGIARIVASRGRGRLGALGLTIALSPLLAPGIGRSLLAISALRFAVLVLINAVCARAIGVDIPLWQLAASLPFAVIANALALTPGGLGLSEWAIASALFALGTSFQLSAQWALATRVLVGLAAVCLGAAGLVIVVAARPAPTARPDDQRNSPR